MGAWTDIGMCHHGIAGLADFEDIERRLCITVAVRDRLSQSKNLSGCIALGKTSRCRKPCQMRFAETHPHRKGSAVPREFDDCQSQFAVRL